MRTALFDDWDEPIEARLRRARYLAVAGLDEVGRGSLAGPVVAAAVILRNLDTKFVQAIDDSKRLTPAERASLDRKIWRHAFAVGIGTVDAAEIDKINILQASFKAMRIALQSLGKLPDFVLVDGHLKLPGIEIPQQAVVGGDARCKCIGAASIIAKVHRDRLMCEFDRVFPQYKFAANKGYGTTEHWRALARYGPSPIHRLSFRGVASANPKAFAQMGLIET